MADNYKTLNCPACGERMQKIFLANSGVNIDICDKGCGGILLDNREYKLIDEQHETLDDYIVEIENKHFDFKPNQEEVRVCPLCGANMVKNPTSIKGKVIIDECYTCGAKFLDHGELTKLREEYATEQERADAAIRALLYSPEGAELGLELGLSAASARVQRKLDNRNHSLLGKLFNKLMGL